MDEEEEHGQQHGQYTKENRETASLGWGRFHRTVFNFFHQVKRKKKNRRATAAVRAQTSMWHVEPSKDLKLRPNPVHCSSCQCLDSYSRENKA